MNNPSCALWETHPFTSCSALIFDLDVGFRFLRRAQSSSTSSILGVRFRRRWVSVPFAIEAGVAGVEVIGAEGVLPSEVVGCSVESAFLDDFLDFLFFFSCL